MDFPDYTPLTQLPTRDLLALVPAELARATRVLPVALEKDVLVLATTDPLVCEMEHLDRIRFVLNRDVRLIAAPRATLEFALWRCYGA
jgi:hypothetical protein